MPYSPNISFPRNLAIKIDDKKIKESRYIETENKLPKYSKGFMITNMSRFGYNFKFIDLNNSINNIDSLLKAENINFKQFIKSNNSYPTATEIE